MQQRAQQPGFLFQDRLAAFCSSQIRAPSRCSHFVNLAPEWKATLVLAPWCGSAQRSAANSPALGVAVLEGVRCRICSLLPL
jgi:hypothetical protein